MKRFLTALAIFVAASTPLWAPPQNNPAVVVVSSAPSGSCTSNEVRMAKSTGAYYACLGGVWTQIGDTIRIQGFEISTTDPTDLQVLTYVASENKWKPQTGSGSSSGTAIIQESGTTVLSNASTLNFSTGFDVAVSGQVATVTYDYTEDPVSLNSGSGEFSGTLPVASGGTGSTTSSGARSNLGAAASGANSDITSLTGTFTTPLGAANGGTAVSAIADDQIVVGTGTNTTAVKTIPDCQAGNQLLYTQSSNTFSCEADGASGTGTIKIIQNAGSSLGIDGSGTTIDFRQGTGGVTALEASGTGAVKTVKLSTSPGTGAAVVDTDRTITPGTGLTGSAALPLSANISLSTDSSESSFINSGTLTCGSTNTYGKALVSATTPLQYCDNATTNTLRYAAYGDTSGNATSGDSATSFFGAGTLEVARGGTGVSSWGSSGDVFYNNGGVLGFESTFSYNSATDTLTVGTLSSTDPGNGFRRMDLLGNTTDVATPSSGTTSWYSKGTAGSEYPYFKNTSGTVFSVAAAAPTEDATLVADGTKYIAAVLPTGCSNATTSKLLYNSTTNAFSCGTDQSSSSAGGSPTEIQYNNAGALGGMTGVTWTSVSSTATFGASTVLSFADSALLNMSGVNNNSATEGIRLPQAADVSAGIAEGQIAWDSDGDQLSIGNGSAAVKVATGLTKSAYWGAGGLSVSGACATPAEATPVSSGPKQYMTSCGDTAGGTIYGGLTMPDGWDGGTVTFEIAMIDINATPADIIAFDVSAMCRRDNDAVSSTYGTAVAADVNITAGSYAQNDIIHANTATPVTPNGTCAGGAMLFWKIVMDEGTTTTTQTNATLASSDIKIFGVKMEYTQQAGD